MQLRDGSLFRYCCSATARIPHLSIMYLTQGRLKRPSYPLHLNSDPGEDRQAWVCTAEHVCCCLSAWRRLRCCKYIRNRPLNPSTKIQTKPFLTFSYALVALPQMLLRNNIYLWNFSQNSCCLAMWWVGQWWSLPKEWSASLDPWWTVENKACFTHEHVWVLSPCIVLQFNVTTLSRVLPGEHDFGIMSFI